MTKRLVDLETLTRRGLIGRAAALAGGALLGEAASKVARAADASPEKPAKPRLSACIEMLYTQLPFNERPAAVKKAGLPAFEFWGLGGKDLEALSRTSRDLGLEIAACVADVGGPLVAEGSAERIVEPMKASIKAAKTLGTKRMIVTVGNEIRGVERAVQHDRIVAAMKAAAPLVEDADVTLVIEPLNTRVNHKGYYLWSSDEGFQIVDEVGSPRVKLLFDIYHQQIMEGDLARRITGNLAKVGHLHVADNPGRHEPGTGEIDYAFLFRTITSAGYNGFFGLEFSPTGSPDDALKSVKAMAGLT